MNLCYFICLLCFVIQNVHSQYESFRKQQKPPFYEACAGANQTRRVEHFFNLIFSEFHTYPPICVCVQMCPNQSTYCYPNNCFRKSQHSLKRHIQSTAQVSQVQPDQTQPMSFLVSLQDSLNEPIAIAPAPIVQPPPVKFAHSNSFNDMSKNSFKERYKSTFKFRKTPQVHLRYNLREQIKHKKSDIIKIEKIDMPKSKWPGSVYEKKRAVTSETKNRRKPVIDENPIKFFPPHFDIGLNTQYQSKFFKRDLTKKLPMKEIDLDIAIEDDDEKFSLNDLIENLIENTFGIMPNDTQVGLNVNLNYSSIEPITLPNKINILNEIANETTNVVSISNTNESIQVNAYQSDNKDQIYRNVFNEMIASLAKKIELNNNSSKEIMETVIGLRVPGTITFDKRETTTNNELPSIMTNQTSNFTTASSVVERRSIDFNSDNSTTTSTPMAPTTENTTTALPTENTTIAVTLEIGISALPMEIEISTLPTMNITTPPPTENSWTSIEASTLSKISGSDTINNDTASIENDDQTTETTDIETTSIKERVRMLPLKRTIKKSHQVLPKKLQHSKRNKRQLTRVSNASSR